MWAPIIEHRPTGTPAVVGEGVESSRARLRVSAHSTLPPSSSEVLSTASAHSCQVDLFKQFHEEELWLQVLDARPVHTIFYE